MSEEDSHNGIRAAMRSLRSAQKSNRGAPLYSRLINRPVGRVFAAVAFRLNLRPNQVTVISACFTFTGILLIALVEPRQWVGLLVAALLMTGYALDSADGQLARLRGGGSRTGEWLDHMFDCVKNSTIHLAVLVSFYRFFDFENTMTLLIPALFGSVASTLFFGFILTDKLRRPGEPALARDDARRPPMLRSILTIPADPGALCLAMVALGFRDIFVVVYAFLFIGCTGYLAAGVVKWYRDVRTLDANAASSAH